MACCRFNVCGRTDIAYSTAILQHNQECFSSESSNEDGEYIGEEKSLTPRTRKLFMVDSVWILMLFEEW